MAKYKLSVILPSIAPEKWTNIYNQLVKATNGISFELIACGPYFPTKNLENISNFKFIRDFGSPSRCFQIASGFVEGEFLCWCSDDYLIENDSILDTFKMLDNIQVGDDCINLLFSEGPNFTGNQHLDLNYWNAYTHNDLRKPGIKSNWKISGAFMYKKETWDKFGGLDCKFEHVNMNTHDLGFAIQANGGTIINSPRRVFAADWKPWDTLNKNPIQLAFEENDKPRFENLYSDEDYAFRRKISLDNWKQADNIWKRRFYI
jgi:hypothetical protein